MVERRAVVLMLPLDVQAASTELSEPPLAPALAPVRPGDRSDAVLAALAGAERPAIIAGRGAVLSGAGPALRRLGELSGAVLATSAVANGLFAGDPFAVGISGGFASPTAQRLLGEADVVIAFGAALNMWTTRHGGLIGPDTTVIQVDRDEEAIGAHRPRLDSASSATRARRPRRSWPRSRRVDGDFGAARRSVALAAEIAAGRWRDEPYEESREWLDPRTLSIALDDLLPDGADRGRRLGRVHGLPVDVPAGAGRAGLRVPAGVPVRRARAGHGDRRRDRAARTA